MDSRHDRRVRRARPTRPADEPRRKATGRATAVYSGAIGPGECDRGLAQTEGAAALRVESPVRRLIAFASVLESLLCDLAGCEVVTSPYSEMKVGFIA